MGKSVASSLYVQLVAETSGWESGMDRASASTKRFESVAKQAARSGAFSLGEEDTAQIRKALELRQRMMTMGSAEAAGPVRVTDKMVGDESRSIIANRLIASKEASDRAMEAATAAKNHLIAVKESEAQSFAAAEARKQDAMEQTAATSARLSSINAKIAAVSSGSRFDNANPFQQQVMLTQKLNALLEKRKTITDEVGRAENRLAITQQVAAVRAARSNLTAGPASSYQHMDAYSKKASQLGVKLQQTGYQVQDFIVQVSSGQNAMVAFAQQGSQLAGALSPNATGAIVGAGLAIGVLAYQVLSATKGIKEQTAALDELESKIKSITKSKRDFSFSQKNETDQLAQLTGETDKARSQFEKTLSERGNAAKKPDLDFTPKQWLMSWKMTLLNYGILYANGMTNAQIASEKLKKAEADRIDQFGKLTDKEQDELRALRAYNDKVIDAYKQRRDASRSEGQKELSAYAELEKQKGNVRTIEYQNAQAKIEEIQREAKNLEKESSMIGESDTSKFTRLMKEMDDLYAKGLEGTNEGARKQNEINSFLNGLKSQSDEIKDQLDNTRAISREREKINLLISNGLLTEKQANDYLKVKANKTVLGLQSRIPQALQMNTGTSALGGMVGSGTANTIIDIQKGILDGIRQLVRIELTGGPN